MKIDNREIDLHHPPYIVAEIGTCEGNIALAKQTMQAAMDCGADAVKIQCYTADEMACQGGMTVEDGPWYGQNLYELYKKNEIDEVSVSELFKYARKQHITLFASAFSPAGVGFLVRNGAPAIKIASFELTDTPLISAAARTGLPVIISTGMGTTKEITDAIHTYNKSSPGGVGRNLGLLHCVSNYPADARDANLPMLGTLSQLVGGRHVVGYSDHVLGNGTAIAAVAYGASIIEKHFILDREFGGDDASFSLEPSEFDLLVRGCHDAWLAVQSSTVRLDASMQKYRRAVWVVQNVCAGSVLTEQHVRVLRGGNGVAPAMYPDVLGARATRDLKSGEPLAADDFSAE